MRLLRTTTKNLVILLVVRGDFNRGILVLPKTAHPLTKKGRPSGAWQVSYSKHSAQDNFKIMAPIQDLSKVGKLAYSQTKLRKCFKIMEIS